MMNDTFIVVKNFSFGFVSCLILAACNGSPTTVSTKAHSKTIETSKKSTKTNPVSDTTHCSKKYLDNVKIERFEYPQMSYCGGALEGIYSNDVLIRIESTYGYDMGYSEKNIDFKDGLITRIEYRQHDADWVKYNQRYGSEEGDIDPSKMTYFDTLYVLTFKPEREFIIYSGKERVHREVSKELIQHLLDCTAAMKTELRTARSKN
jgi:hypothetical protein